MFGAAFFAVFFTADTCMYTRRETMERHAPLAAHCSTLSSVYVTSPTYLRHGFSSSRCTLSSNVQGSKEQEKKKVSFHSRHLSLSRCVGSVNFDDILW